MDIDFCLDRQKQMEVGLNDSSTLPNYSDTGLISQANGSKVVYLLAETNVALLKANFHLYVEHHVTWKVVFYSLTMKNKKEKKEALEIVIHLN